MNLWIFLIWQRIKIKKVLDKKASFWETDRDKPSRTIRRCINSWGLVLTNWACSFSSCQKAHFWSLMKCLGLSLGNAINIQYKLKTNIKGWFTWRNCNWGDCDCKFSKWTWLPLFDLLVVAPQSSWIYV